MYNMCMLDKLREVFLIYFHYCPIRIKVQSPFILLFFALRVVHGYDFLTAYTMGSITLIVLRTALVDGSKSLISPFE